MSKHTPEPWVYDEDRAAVRFDGRGNPVEGDRIGCIICEPQKRSDGRRIVACVNALAGVADPAAFVKAARELAAAVDDDDVVVIDHEGDEISISNLTAAFAAADARVGVTRKD